MSAFCDEEAEVAFFICLITSEDVVFRRADGGVGFPEGFPEGGEVCRVVASADFVAAVPCAGAVEFPRAATGEGVTAGYAGYEVSRVVCR